MERPLVLLVGGETASAASLRRRLEDRGHEVLIATGASGAFDVLRTSPVQILVGDVDAPGVGDDEFARRAARIRPSMVTVLLEKGTSPGTASRRVERGAFEVADPGDEAALDLVLQRATNHHRLLADHLRLRDEARFRSGFHRLVGRSEAMERVRERLERLAASETPVLLTGEPGSGKELAARTLHALSARRDRPFVVVDCASGSSSALERELFGVARGTADGAGRAVSGLLEAARGGTVFLDEICSLPLPLQERLRDALLEGLVRRAEGDGVPLDARVTAATSVDPDRAMRDHRFHEDLYRNLSQGRVHLSPLRERREDIPLLAHAFVESIREMNELPPLRLTPETLAVLERYRWPGNVRELRNAVEHAVILAGEGAVRPKDLPAAVALPEEGRGGQDRVSGPKFRDAKKRVVEGFERTYLSDLLAAHGGNVTAAAQHAGMLRSALQRLLRKYDLKSADFRRESRESATTEPS